MATFDTSGFTREKPFNMTFGNTVKITEVITYDDIYTGPTELIPDTQDQLFLTKDKSVKDDLTVKAIPYAETSNESGTTVVIAS